MNTIPLSSYKPPTSDIEIFLVIPALHLHVETVAISAFCRKGDYVKHLREIPK